MLTDYYKYFLNYLIYLYGGEYSLEGTLLFLRNDKDVFKVNLLDGSRFNKFTFFHQNKLGHNVGHFHKQFCSHTLEWGLFKAFTHQLNLDIGYYSTQEDWHRFEKDVLKYKML